MKKQALTLVFTILMSIILVNSIVIKEECVPNLINSSFSPWTVHSECNIFNIETEERSLVTYDSNNCGLIENTTYYEYKETRCDYCSPDIESFFTPYSICLYNNTRTRTKYYLDLNYDNCCKKTNISSDCIIDNIEYANISETSECKQFNIDIFSPSEKVYNTKRILLTLISEENLSKLDYIDSNDKRPMNKQLCTKCYKYNRSMSFNDGVHNISLIGLSLDGRTTVEKIDFIVDSKKPMIMLPKVRKQGYTNGSFLIDYSEENVKEVILNYKDKSISRFDCPSGKNKECEFDVDLSSLNGQVINYKFRVIDIAGNYYDSKNFSALVDTIPPQIVNFDYEGVIMGIDFNIEIFEANFLDVSYIDHSDKYSRWKVLCPVLKSGFCTKKLSFKPGEHNITVKISDRAGNFVTKEI